MNVYTTYFAKIRNLPDSIVPIAICASVPKWFDGPVYKVLAPPFKLVADYKQDHDESKYTSQFTELVLSKLDPNKVMTALNAISGGKDVAMVCYEKSSDFCHRHLVSQWLNESSITCSEYKY